MSAGETAPGPLVTIGCAVYNGAATLERALRPLLEQDYPHLEIIIADDASTDDTVALAEQLTAADPRVRIIRNPANVGLTENFNRLAHAAHGEYFMWADQDDIRERSYVRRAVAALEASPGAVLCHSHTGAFIGNPEDVKYIVKLTGVAGVQGRVHRYVALLRRYADTTVYGLIRMDALRRTRLWRPTLGSSNALLFELILLGSFIEVPDVLYRYSGLGLRRRTTPQVDFARTKRGRLPWYYVPFLVLAWNQSDGILRHVRNPVVLLALLGALWGNVALVFMTKLAYRSADRLLGGRTPSSVTQLCSRLLSRGPDMQFLNGADRDHDLFPPAWDLRAKPQRRTT